MCSLSLTLLTMETITPVKIPRRKQEVFECFEEDLSDIQKDFYEKAEREREDFLSKFEINFGNRTDIVVTKRDPCTFVEYFSSGILAPVHSNGRVVQASASNPIFVLNRGLTSNPPLFVTSISPSTLGQATPVSFNTTAFTSRLVTTSPVSTITGSAVRSTSGIQLGAKTVTPKSTFTLGQIVISDAAKRPLDKSSVENEIPTKRPKPLGTINLDPSCDISKVTTECTSSTSSSGRTYPSLVVIAQPCLRGPSDDSSSALAAEKSNLELHMKRVLSFSSDKFTEWLIQVGLVRTDHFCSLHKGEDGNQVKLKLGMYTESQKFPFSGGYIWVSDCCSQQFVSLFSGSLFESSSFPPQTSLKLIYFWANHTSIQNIMQWMNVPNIFIKNLYTNIRAVCTAAVHEHTPKMGGPHVPVQVAVLSLGSSKTDGHLGKVKVEILAALDAEKNIVRLRAIEPFSEADVNNYRVKFMKIFEILPTWVAKNSVILADDTIDITSLKHMGFPTVTDAAVKDKDGNEVQPNLQLVDYLKSVIPKMFVNTLSVLSRVVIQQFLDELVWREHFGHYPAKAFESITKHLIEQTKLDTGGNLCNRLNKISSNPFKDWKYSKWKANCSWRPSSTKSVTCTTKAKPRLSTSKDPNIVPHFVTSKMILNSSGVAQMVNVASPISQKPSPLSSAAALKQIKIVSQTPSVPGSLTRSEASLALTEDLSNPNIAKIYLENYYYGQLEGEKDKQFLNIDLQIPCFSCRKLFTSNMLLTDHLISHALNLSLISNDLKEICKFCMRVISSKLLLQQHYLQYHADFDLYSPKEAPKCLICNIKFREMPFLISHMTKVHYEMELPYICQVCNFRTSVFYKMLNHITSVHDRDDSLFCPYCFKVIHLLRNGVPSEKNQYNFIYHIRKHQLSLNKKCMKCAIYCINKTVLMHHETTDHASCSKTEGVEKLINEQTLMPKPLENPSPPKMDRYKVSIGCPYKISSSVNLILSDDNPDAHCIECEAKISNDHYVSEILCMQCPYNTYCARAISEHYICSHEVGTSGLQVSHVPTTSSRTLYCSCSFSTTDGNSMAQHLVQCKKETAYLEPLSSLSNSSLKAIMNEEGDS